MIIKQIALVRYIVLLCNALYSSSINGNTVLTSLSNSSYYSDHLSILLQDFKLYVPIDSKDNDAGKNRYEHVVLAYVTMAKLFEKNVLCGQPLVLSPRQKEIALLAIVFHDIGNAGRKELFDCELHGLKYEITKTADGTVACVRYNRDQKESAAVGFKYIADPFLENLHYPRRPSYQCIGTQGSFTSFSIRDLYQELSLNQEEQQIIAILAGMSNAFTMLVQGSITNQHFMGMLAQYARIVGYNSGRPDELIVKLAVLIDLASVSHLSVQNDAVCTVYASLMEYYHTRFCTMPVMSIKNIPPALLVM